MLIGILALCVSLSMDSIVLGASYGIRGTIIPTVSKCIIAFCSMIYAAAALWFGGGIAGFIPPSLAQYMGGGILIVLGLGLLVTSLRKEKESPTISKHDGIIFNVFIKPLGITIQILRHPAAGDRDQSGVIEAGEALLIGFALSLDSIGASFASAISGMTAWYIPFLIGLTQLLFLNIGLRVGHCSTRIGKYTKVFDVLPGTLIMLLGIFRFI